MESQELLYNIPGLLETVITDVRTWGEMGDVLPSKWLDTLLGAVGDSLREHLKPYGEKYSNKLNEFAKYRDESQRDIQSYKEQIDSLRGELKEEKEAKESTEYGYTEMKRQRDAIIQKADTDHVDFEQRKLKMEDICRELRVQVNRHKLEVRNAIQDRESAYDALKKKTEKYKGLKRRHGELDKKYQERCEQLNQYHAHIENMREIRKSEEKEVTDLENKLEGVQQQNKTLVGEITRLNTVLEKEKETTTELERTVEKLQPRLKEVENELEEYKLRSPEPLSAGMRPIEGVTAADDLSGSDLEDASESGQPESPIETKYVMRTVHEEEIERLQNKSANYQAKAEKLNEEIDTLTQKVLTLETEANDYRATIDKLTKNNASSQTALETLKVDLTKERDGSKKLSEEIQTLKQQAETLKAGADGYRTEMEKLKKEHADCQITVEKLKVDLAKERDDSQKLKEEIKTLKQQVEALDAKAGAYRTETGRLKNDHADCQTTVEKLRSDLAKETNDNEKLNKKIEELTQKAATLEAEANGYRADIETLKSDNTSGQTTAEKLEEDLAKERDNRNKFDEKIKTLTQKVETLEAEANDYRADIERLRNENAIGQKTAEQLNQDLKKERDDRNKSDEGVKTLTQKVATLEAEAVANRADIQREQEKARKFTKQFTTDGDRIVELEKIKEEHEAKIENLQATIEELRNRPVPEMASRLAQTNFESDDQDKDKSIRDLTDQIKAQQVQLEKLALEKGTLADLPGQLETLQEQLKEARAQIDALKADEGVSKSLIQTLKDEVADLNRQLEQYVKETQDPDEDEDEDEVIKATKKLLRTLLAIKAPSIADINALLADLINLQKTIPGATPFEPADVQVEKDKRLDESDRERKRLEDENKRLGDETKRIQEESKLLGEEITRLGDETKRLEQENKNLAAEVASLTETVADQKSVIGKNGQQAAGAQGLLTEEITKWEAALKDLTKTMEAQQQMQATERVLNRIRKEIDSYKSLIQSLTAACDLLEDIRGAHAAVQKSNRQRGRVDKDPAAEAGTADADGSGRPRSTLSSVRRILGGTFRLPSRQMQHSFVWSILLTMLFGMGTVTIAEARLYSEWRNANEHTRALWMTVDDRPTICFGAPRYDYFWDTILVVLSGRWLFS